MKILICHFLNDPRFRSLTQPINSLDNVVVGTTDNNLSQEDLKSFNPDIIVHNHPEESRISNSINIHIHENSIGFGKDIDPFVALRRPAEINQKYKSDVCFIGDAINVFGDNLYYIIQNNRLRKLFFHHEPMPYRGYAGVCANDKFFDIYALSKASIVASNDDKYRLLDILYAGGNPVVFTNKEQFHKDILDAVFDHKVFNPLNLTSKDIQSQHTNFDRISWVFKQHGLNKFGEELLVKKERIIS